MIVQTTKKREIIDITDLISQGVRGKGIVYLFVAHTTAALTTADLDPGTDIDLLNALESMTPSRPWKHPHNPAHFPDHLWASIIGPGLSIPYRDDQLLLGGWQRVILVELDGPRERQIEITLLAV